MLQLLVLKIRKRNLIIIKKIKIAENRIEKNNLLYKNNFLNIINYNY